MTETFLETGDCAAEWLSEKMTSDTHIPGRGFLMCQYLKPRTHTWLPLFFEPLEEGESLFSPPASGSNFISLWSLCFVTQAASAALAKLTSA